MKIRETAINTSFFSIGWHRVTTATILSLSKQFFTERSLTICAASLSSTIITCNRLKLKKFEPLKIGLFLPVYGISSQYFAKIKYLVDQISKKLNLWSIVGFSSNSDFNDILVFRNADCNIHDSLLYGRQFTVNSVASDLNLNATHRPWNGGNCCQLRMAINKGFS